MPAVFSYIRGSTATGAGCTQRVLIIKKSTTMKQLIIFAMAAMFGLALFAGNPPMVGTQEKVTYFGRKAAPGLDPPCKGLTTRPCAIEEFTVISAVDNGTSTRVLCKVTREYPDGLVMQCTDREFDVPQGMELVQFIIDNTTTCLVLPTPPDFTLGTCGE